MEASIVIRNARLHNLKNVSLSIPKNKLVVVTGLSGSGKSTLAFDTLHKEGQRQYMESIGTVTDAISKPPMDGISGLSPSISVDQHLTNHSPRSTVGTVTEVFTYLRVLFARIGHRPCTGCGKLVPPPLDLGEPDAWDDAPSGLGGAPSGLGGAPSGLGGASSGLGGADDDLSGVDLTESYPCPHCSGSVPELGMAHFSFNKPAGACATCTGLGIVMTGNLAKLIDPDCSILDGGVMAWDRYEIERYSQTLRNVGRLYGFEFDPALPIKDYSPVQRDLLLYGVGSAQIRERFPGVPMPDTVAKGRFEGVVTNLLRKHADRAHDVTYRETLERLLIKDTCPDCDGTRLRPESRAVRVAGLTLIDLARMPLAELAAWIAELSDVVPETESAVIGPIVDDLQERVRRLVDVGVGYLTMERSSPTLSAGEAQRLRLASLLGSGLTGVLYVLDEPTIGLHQRDTHRLILVLRRLRDLGNTILVIEHDLDMVRAADMVIDMGPGAGELGGEVVAIGTPEEVSRVAASLTGQYLVGQAEIALPERRRLGNGARLTLRGARAHNLRDVTVTLPLGLLIAVTGVSGSGKSSLMLDILDRAARQHFHGAEEQPGEHDGIEGWQYLDKIVTIDQTAIGRTTRSNAATYTDSFTPIREVFARTEAAKARGLGAAHFSFNVAGGRCERCQGAGSLTVNMHFLPDVEVRCPACRGRRFRREVLEVLYRGHSIADVLELTIQQAAELFADVPAAQARLALMVEVGMGYLKMGQPATTLSGGEAQRVKLAKELARRATGRTLYLLDEPTTGLHIADTANLLKVLHGLVDAGNTVLTIEHNLDVIKTADWVIDLGPEGGKAGGLIVAQGPPELVANVAESYTGRFLRSTLAHHQKLLNSKQVGDPCDTHVARPCGDTRLDRLSEERR
jgi:excinuclease ABC subunit A